MFPQPGDRIKIKNKKPLAQQEQKFLEPINQTQLDKIKAATSTNKDLTTYPSFAKLSSQNSPVSKTANILDKPLDLGEMLRTVDESRLMRKYNKNFIKARIEQDMPEPT